MKKYFLLFLVALLATIIFFSIKKYRIKHNPEYRFSKIYETNEWGGSGLGSDPNNVKPYLEILQDIFNDPQYTSFVDLGSGDWRLMATIEIPENKKYKGFDLVKKVIDITSKNYSKPNVSFYHIHKLKDLINEKADMLVIKDVMQHWGNNEIKYFLENILPNYKYALITNDYKKDALNEDIKSAHFRPIDIEKEPYNLNNIRLLKEYQAHGILKRTYLYTNPK